MKTHKKLPLLGLLFVLLSSSLHADPVLTRWLPYEYTDEMSYVDKTPLELLNTTNAYRIFGAEYYSYDNLIAGVFASYTKDGIQYDKPSNVFCRDQGEEILIIEEWDVEGFRFLANFYQDVNQEEKIRISFALADLGNQIRLFKQWSPEQIVTVHDLCNYELTFSTVLDARLFLEAMVIKIVDEHDLFQLGNAPCPEIYVAKVQYVNEQHILDLNKSANGNIILDNGVEERIFDISNSSKVFLDNDFVLAGNFVKITNDFNEGEDFVYLDPSSFLSSVTTTDKTSISIFPNPSTDYLILECEDVASFYIVNTSGKICMQDLKQSKYKRVDIKHLTSGQYYLMIMQGKQLNQKSFVKI